MDLFWLDPTDPIRVGLWDAISLYVRTCGGDTGNKTISPERMGAVALVEKAVESAAFALAVDAKRRNAVYTPGTIEAKLIEMYNDLIVFSEDEAAIRTACVLATVAGAVSNKCVGELDDLLEDEWRHGEA